MRKFKILLTVNIIQIILLVASIVASVFVLPKVMLFSNEPIPLTVVLGSETDKLSGFAQVTSYGAIPDDDKDDTDAFRKALKTNASIYIPVGTYDIDETLEISNKTLKGSGTVNTVLRFNSKDTAISLKGNTVVQELTVCYSDKVLSGKEGKGECVAIYDNGMTQGSMLRGVAFKNIGTGFLSDVDKMGAFCTTIEGITFEDYSYKALEIKNGLSSVIRSVTVKSGKSDKLIPVTLGGVVTVENICFDNVAFDCAIGLKDSTSAVFKSLTFNKAKALSDSFICCENSRFTLQTVNLLGSQGENLISIKDNEKSNVASDGLVLEIYTDADDISVCKDGKITCDTILN